MEQYIRYNGAESSGNRFWISCFVEELAKEHKTVQIQFSVWHNDLYFEHFSVVQYLDTELLRADQIHNFDISTRETRARLISVLFLSSCYTWSLDLLIDGVVCLQWDDEVLISFAEAGKIHQFISCIANVNNWEVYD